MRAGIALALPRVLRKPWRESYSENVNTTACTSNAALPIPPGPFLLILELLEDIWSWIECELWRRRGEKLGRHGVRHAHREAGDDVPAGRHLAVPRPHPYQDLKR